MRITLSVNSFISEAHARTISIRIYDQIILKDDCSFSLSGTLRSGLAITGHKLNKSDPKNGRYLITKDSAGIRILRIPAKYHGGEFKHNQHTRSKNAMPLKFDIKAGVLTLFPFILASVPEHPIKVEAPKMLQLPPGAPDAPSYETIAKLMPFFNINFHSITREWRPGATDLSCEAETGVPIKEVIRYREAIYPKPKIDIELAQLRSDFDAANEMLGEIGARLYTLERKNAT